MDTHRPQIDMDKYHHMLEADSAYQQTHNEPKDPPARFCGMECRESYREERMSGVQLPRHNMNGQDVSHKAMCAKLNLCAYCRSKLEK